MKTKSIAIVRKYSGYGGIEHQIENIMFGLNKKGWKVLLISDKVSPLTQKCVEQGVEIVIIHLENTIKAAREIIKQCKIKDIQIIQSHMLKESFLCGFVKLFNPQIKHVFRVHTYIDCSHISRLKKNVYHAAAKIISPFIDQYLPINEYNEREMVFRTRLSKQKIQVIHDAVRFQMKNEYPHCDFKNNKIAMVANFVDFKGHDVLLDGLKILRDKGYKIEAYLVGGVPGKDTDSEDFTRLNIVQDTIRKYRLENMVVICGYSSNIPEAIKECGILVLPSDAEGTPNVLLEAMILRKIVVASKVGGVPEFVKDGETGFLHESKNAEDFANTIIRAYHFTESQLDAIAEKAVRLVESEYCLEGLIMGLIKVYESLLL
ncbi:MAG: glycosyltransferase family 4 protein [Dorea sp.]|nr:glycosyltransferase family 4 protein [Dorea sp.]